MLYMGQLNCCLKPDKSHRFLWIYINVTLVCQFYRGNDYEQHTKCITEEEKYSGKNYVAKPNANKGEKKQDQWLQVLQHIQNVYKQNISFIL